MADCECIGATCRDKVSDTQGEDLYTLGAGLSGMVGSLLSGALTGAMTSVVSRERGWLSALTKANGLSKQGMWYRLNPPSPERREIRKAQCKAWREEVMRPMWIAYCKAHRLKFPRDVPMGFGRFISDKHYKLWMSDPDRLLASPNRRSRSSASAWKDRAMDDRYKRPKGSGPGLGPVKTKR